MFPMAVTDEKLMQQRRTNTLKKKEKRKYVRDVRVCEEEENG